MGQLKALLPWRGTSLIEHQVAELQSAGIARVIVVLGYQAEQVKAVLEGREGVSCVANPDYRRGKTTSIKAGLQALGPEEPSALLVLNVDQPRGAGDTPATSSSIIILGDSLITIPTFRGKGGHPIVLDSLTAG